jgi:hypothetical protein
MSGKDGLLEWIDGHKAKVSHNQTFEVTITETLRMTVAIEAKSRANAEEIAEANWNNSDYILDADHFVGAKFEAASVKRERAAGAEL